MFQLDGSSIKQDLGLGSQTRSPRKARRRATLVCTTFFACWDPSAVHYVHTGRSVCSLITGVFGWLDEDG